MSAARALAAILAAAALLASAGALAYETYSTDRASSHCASCHGGFGESPYISRADGQSWGDDLHDVHSGAMLNGDCDVCHSGPGRFPVRLGSSTGGAGLAPAGCSGCHGRAQDALQPGTTAGFAAGLRQHHDRAGVTSCRDCHADSDPARRAVAGENVLPPYFADPGAGHPAIPSNPCNPPPAYAESFGATRAGLDNDGDGIYDAADTDCGGAVCGNGALETGERCDDGNTEDGDCCSAVCMFEPSGAPCEASLFCVTGRACDGAGGCSGGEGHVCADEDLCTDDACDEDARACVHVFDTSNAPECRCGDSDGDGHSPSGGACGPRDCDDADGAVHPAAAELCGDDRDNDCDGDVDAADAACADSAGDWTIRRGPLEDTDYAGSRKCAGCHAGQFRSWQGSLHARILIRPGDAQAAGFPLPEAPPEADGTATIRTWGDVLFVIGQKWKARFVDRAGTIQAGEWNFLEGGWSAAEAAPYTCGACHTTGYDPAASYIDAGGRPVPGIAGSWVEFNVGCEACHGPGARHSAKPSRKNINRIVLDWSADGEGIVEPALRAAEVCGHCHHRNGHGGLIDPARRNHDQFNAWRAGPHAATVEATALNTYCAKCHSPGNARFEAGEHNFRSFKPSKATHVSCISCHDPHETSHPRWTTLEWPEAGRRDPKDSPVAIARYLGTDRNPRTEDARPIPAGRSNDLCTDCHRTSPGFRRHADASPPEKVALAPPYNGGAKVEVPHARHVREGQATCMDCHMPYSRVSINRWDIRTHSFLPDEFRLGGVLHYAQTCGACHAEAGGCVWCHSDLDAALEAASDRPRMRREEKPGEAEGGN